MVVMHLKKIRRHKQNRWREATRKRQRIMADVIDEVTDLGKSLFLGLKFVIFVGLYWRPSSHTAYVIYRDRRYIKKKKNCLHSFVIHAIVELINKCLG